MENSGSGIRHRRSSAAASPGETAVWSTRWASASTCSVTLSLSAVPLDAPKLCTSCFSSSSRLPERSRLSSGASRALRSVCAVPLSAAICEM